MQLNVKLEIDNNPNLRRYLKENSHWYHFLNRDPMYLKLMEEEMKKKYKLTPEDKLEKMNNNIALIKEFLSILK